MEQRRIQPSTSVLKREPGLAAAGIDFNVSTFHAMQTGLDTNEYSRLVWTPDALGSICFLVSGVIAYAIHGDVNVGYAALVGLPAAGSVAFATSLQQRLRSGTVELLFAGFMVVVAVWLFVK